MSWLFAGLFLLEGVVQPSDDTLICQLDQMLNLFRIHSHNLLIFGLNLIGRSLLPFSGNDGSSDRPFPNDVKNRPSCHGKVKSVGGTEGSNLYEGHAQNDVSKFFHAQSSHQLGKFSGWKNHVHPGEPEERHHRVTDGTKETGADRSRSKESRQVFLANFVRILFGLAEIVYSAWKKGFFIF